MVQILIVPLLVELKATCFASGESFAQPILSSHSTRSWSRAVCRSNARIVLPPFEEYAIRFPSGNQLGQLQSLSESLLTEVGFLPSASMIQSSSVDPIRTTL